MGRRGSGRDRTRFDLCRVAHVRASRLHRELARERVSGSADSVAVIADEAPRSPPAMAPLSYPRHAARRQAVTARRLLDGRMLATRRAVTHATAVPRALPRRLRQASAALPVRARRGPGPRAPHVAAARERVSRTRNAPPHVADRLL